MPQAETSIGPSLAREQDRALVTGDRILLARQGRALISGTQALVRLALLQRWRDQREGLNTAGFISGYRGSPLGGLDQSLWSSAESLRENHIRFQPAINEELAATAVLGSQQVALSDSPKYDGVFAMWYGKGPGVDRAGDALKHGNAFGAAPRGGVLVVAGDDHGAVSSSMGHQSEHAMISWMMPVLNPASIQDYLDLGVMGFALSRFSGCWVGFKAISETVESSAVVDLALDRVHIRRPTDYMPPAAGLHIRWPDPFAGIESRLHDAKLDAVRAFARANALDRVVMASDWRRLGIVATGKAYLDLREALRELGIDAAAAAAMGLQVFKVGMSWPLEPEGVTGFCRGLERVLVVEEKRPVIEDQLKSLLYGVTADQRPAIMGKADESGRPLLSSIGQLDVESVAAAVLALLPADLVTPAMRQRLAAAERCRAGVLHLPAVAGRTPYFCSGCPHNHSTRVPEGSQAFAGIGCHFMAVGMDRHTSMAGQMGGEGVNWVGRAPFTDESHVFQNLGDGTYFHSGLLAVRQAIAAGVNVTYKILFNDAVAMTGGQPIDGHLSVPEITRQVHAEGARRIAVVADDPGKYAVDAGFAPGTTIHGRDQLDDVQRQMREIPGCTVIVYDQGCAAEKRRRRGRGLEPEPARRVYINPLVCEGCGDCGVQSNCVSILPLETPLGTKRVIDQSSCNKDYGCLKGFCPAMVTVEGGRPRAGIDRVAADREAALLAALPRPPSAPFEKSFNLIFAGVGGTGVVTAANLLATAAAIEGRGVTTLDFAGFAQKGGMVVSHVKLAPSASDINTVRVGAGAADLVMGCDLVVTASPDVLTTIDPRRTRIVANRRALPSGDFTRDPDAKPSAEHLIARIGTIVGDDRIELVDATGMATDLFGDAIASNLFLLGHAWQQGLIPIGLDAIDAALAAKGKAAARNRRVFAWGRLAAHDPDVVRQAGRQHGEEDGGKRSLDEIIIERSWHLAAYQNDSYARRYETLVRRVSDSERQVVGRPGRLAEAVAASYAKLLAYKDEYEVARLFVAGGFSEGLRQQFDGDLRVTWHMAPPLPGNRIGADGRRRKRAFRVGMPTVLKWLAAARRLRGTVFDPFGYQRERRMERRLIAEFEAMVEIVVRDLRGDNHGLACELMELPQRVRGFGPVKEMAVSRYRQESAAALKAFLAPAMSAVAAE